MTTAENLRNSLINKILCIDDAGLLSALDKLLSRAYDESKVVLTEEQVLMLEMSDKDIHHGCVISQEELFKREQDWLKGL